MVTIVTAVVAFSVVLVPRSQAQDGRGAEEVESFALVNAARSDAGASSLSRDGRLDGVARAQAARMVARNAVFHDPDLASHVNATGINWRSLAENVGVGPGVRMVHDAFMASAGHRHNIEAPAYHSIGVGVAQGDGRIFVAHVFAEVVRTMPRAASTDPETRKATSLGIVPVRRAPSTAVRRPSVDPNVVVGGIVPR